MKKKVQLLTDRIKKLDGDLIAVSKTVSEERIREAYSYGLKDFGENYLSEACDKIDKLSDLSIQWHYLGRVQTGTLNKVLNRFTILHTIAKLSHLKKINEKTQDIQKVLIQIKHPTDKRDYGVLEEELDRFLKAAFALKKIKVLGLMFISPLDMRTEDLNEAFLWVRAHFDRIKESLEPEMQEDWKMLSMGMSGDFIEALECGATHVRLGRSIFGER